MVILLSLSLNKVVKVLDPEEAVSDAQQYM